MEKEKRPPTFLKVWANLGFGRQPLSPKETIHRGDLLWEHEGRRVIYDVVVTHPHTGCGADTSPPGSAAEAAHSDKINTYNGRFVIPVGEFEPLAMETGGRLHPRALGALKTFVKATTLGLGATDPIPVHQMPKYNRALRVLLDSLAVSLARQVARALLHAVPDVIGDEAGDPVGGAVRVPATSPRTSRWGPSVGHVGAAPMPGAGAP